MAGLFDGYPLGQQWDEMFAGPAAPRAAYQGLFASLQPMAGEELAARADLLSQTYRDAGVTFAHAGEEQPFPLDLVPRVIGSDEWELIERGVAQRVHALEAFLADVYGAGEVFDDRVVPRSVVTTSAHFHRQAHGLVSPNGVRVHVAGIDLVRDEAGGFRVLEDNLRSPSGVSYVITNRAAMSQVLPELSADHRVQPVADYPTRLLGALKASAPANVAEPTVVVLTPGVYNSAYFEHALLARQRGVELVEGRDPVCAGNRVSMRTTDGQRRVDVIYRRIDDEFLDPVHFRPDSVIGCAGVLNAARAGRVTIANTIGNGVADDKLLYTWVPDLIRYDLGEEPVLQNAETHRLDDEDTVEWVLGSLDRFVLKPVDGSGGKGIVIGPRRRAHADRPRGQGAGPAAELGRPAADRAVDRPDAGRRADRPPARRPAPVRGQRRRPRVGAAGRADPRRASPRGSWSWTPARAAAPSTPAVEPLILIGLRGAATA